MELKFTKMHGIGNDFIVLDLRKITIPNLSGIIKKLSCRRFGIGFDQALILKNSSRADFRMDIYNADGSRVEMCGNGIRCLARYIWDRGLKKKNLLEIETLAGIIKPKKAKRTLVTVDMGCPILEGSLIPTVKKGRIINYPLNVSDKIFKITCVSMGNPHCVIFVRNVDRFPVGKYGPLIETDNFFPKRTNVEFVEVLNKRAIKVRVWERGAGETLACGTGASASIVASSIMGFTERRVDVILKGGSLHIDWAKDDRIYMTGPTEEVFEGTVEV